MEDTATIDAPAISGSTALVCIPTEFDPELRQREIEGKLQTALEMTVLVRADYIFEWIKLNDALNPVSAQLEQKPKGGRPPGGVSEAARWLPLPSMGTPSACRQFVRRSVQIDKISDEAKSVAREEKLDNNQAALLAIASKKTAEAQIEVARTWADRPKQSRARPLGKVIEISGHESLNAAKRKEFGDALVELCEGHGLSVVGLDPLITGDDCQ